MPAIDLELNLLHNPWMHEIETLWLIKQARISKTFAEIGCWKGITTRNIALNAPNCKVMAIDTFAGSSEHRDPASKHFVPELKDDTWLFRQFWENAKQIENIGVMARDSVDAAACVVDGYYTTVFLDASHEYEDVKRDIQAWLPKVRRGGVLCGHDIDWPGVKRAVSELLPNAQQFIPQVATDTQRHIGVIWAYEVPNG